MINPETIVENYRKGNSEQKLNLYLHYRELRSSFDLIADEHKITEKSPGGNGEDRESKTAHLI